MVIIFWITICFYFILKPTHFPSRDFIQQGLSRGNESSDCHVISDELVFEVKFVSKVCSEQKSRLCLRNLYLHKKIISYNSIECIVTQIFTIT